MAALGAVATPTAAADRPPQPRSRTIINGILWVLRTGAPWADLPERYGPVGTVSSRFYRWREAGLWQRVLEALQAQADAAGLLDWDLHFVDASVVRAHQHAAGARRTGVIGGWAPGRGAGTLPWRLLDQDPRPGRGTWQARHLSSDRR